MNQMFKTFELQFSLFFRMWQPINQYQPISSTYLKCNHISCTKTEVKDSTGFGYEILEWVHEQHDTYF